MIRFKRIFLMLALVMTMMALVPGSYQQTAAQRATSTPIVTTTITVQPTEQAIRLLLRNGKGYVILLRHAQTTPGTGDPAGFKLEDCKTQRNLSEAGRTQAVRIGERIKADKIQVAQILSSQWCRCRDTARLMNVGTVTPATMLNSFFEDRTTADEQTKQVEQYIRGHQGESGVVIMVTHQVNITALTGIVPSMGEMVIVRANAQGRVEVAGRIADAAPAS